MSRYTARHLLEVWGGTRGQPHLARALALVSGTQPGVEAQYLPIGDRDRRLLTILTDNFGAGIEAVADCPACSAMIEITLDAARLAETIVEDRNLTIVLRGRNHRLRLPSSSDVAAAAETGFPARMLAMRCLDGDSVVDTLSDDDVERIGHALAAAEPLLDPRIAMTCPDCGAEQEHGFDIAAFLWDKIEVRARGLLTHIHLLARAYGWSEADILALPEARRAAYLDFVMA
jgi:hypothetical protein